MLTPAEYEKHYVKRRLFDGVDWRLKRAVNRHRNRSKEIPSDPHIHLLQTYLQINDGNLDSESVLPDAYAENVIKLGRGNSNLETPGRSDNRRTDDTGKVQQSGGLG